MGQSTVKLKQPVTTLNTQTRPYLRHKQNWRLITDGLSASVQQVKVHGERTWLLWLIAGPLCGRESWRVLSARGSLVLPLIHMNMDHKGLFRSKNYLLALRRNIPIALACGHGREKELRLHEYVPFTPLPFVEWDILTKWSPKNVSITCECMQKINKTLYIPKFKWTKRFHCVHWEKQMKNADNTLDVGVLVIIEIE